MFNNALFLKSLKIKMLKCSKRWILGGGRGGERLNFFEWWEFKHVPVTILTAQIRLFVYFCFILGRGVATTVGG